MQRFIFYFQTHCWKTTWGFGKSELMNIFFSINRSLDAGAIALSIINLHPYELPMSFVISSISFLFISLINLNQLFLLQLRQRVCVTRLNALRFTFTMQRLTWNTSQFDMLRVFLHQGASRWWPWTDVLWRHRANWMCQSCQSICQLSAVLCKFTKLWWCDYGKQSAIRPRPKHQNNSALHRHSIVTSWFKNVTLAMHDWWKLYTDICYHCTLLICVFLLVGIFVWLAWTIFMNCHKLSRNALLREEDCTVFRLTI